MPTATARWWCRSTKSTPCRRRWTVSLNRKRASLPRRALPARRWKASKRRSAAKGKIANLALEDQTRRRAVGEQPPLMIRDPSFGSSDAAARGQDDALGLEQTCFRREGPHE